MGPISNSSKEHLKYIQIQQDLPFGSADVHSGKSLPDRTCLFDSSGCKSSICHEKETFRKNSLKRSEE